jgi:hypothetical protein
MSFDNSNLSKVNDTRTIFIEICHHHNLGKFLESVQMKNQAENNPKWRKVKWSTSPEDSEEVILMLTRNHSYPIGIQ